MKAPRLLLKAGTLLVAFWLLLPVLGAYNRVFLELARFMTDDSLVNRRTFASVTSLHHELFWANVLPYMALICVVLVGSRIVLRCLR